MNLISLYVMNVLKYLPSLFPFIEGLSWVHNILLYYFWFFNNFYRFFKLLDSLVLNDKRNALDKVKSFSVRLFWTLIFDIIHMVISILRTGQQLTAISPLWCATAFAFIIHIYLYFLWSYLWPHLYHVDLWRRWAISSDVKNLRGFQAWGSLINRFFLIVNVGSSWLR